jgi:hypothetical protein
MVDEHATSQLDRRVDLDPGQKAGPVRDPAPQPVKSTSPARIGHAVKHHGVQPGIAGQDFQTAARGGVAQHDGVDIFLQASEHLLRVVLPQRAPFMELVAAEVIGRY